MLAAGDGYGGAGADPALRVNVEFVSAKPTGPLTAASGRHAAYGDALARVLQFAGHEVVREYYFNDAGTQIEKLGESIRARARGEEIPEGGYEGDYVRDLAADIPGAADMDASELARIGVELMFDRIKATLRAYRVCFDVFFSERALHEGTPSAVERGIERLSEQGHLYRSEGALWLRTTDFGDEKDRVLERSTGQPTYFAADVAYAENKLEHGFDLLVIPLGSDHHGYVARLKAAAAMLGYDAERLEVLLYQTVHLTKAGAQTKMSKRRGDVVLLEELMDEVGVDAARWYLVNRGPDQAIDIDIDLAAEKTQKNPVYYVQYAHARIAGILRNAVPGPGPGTAPIQTLAVEERNLIKRLAEFPSVAAEATERRAPQGIPTYAIRVADDFHRFYHEHRVLESESQAFRLGLAGATQRVIARCLDLIGVEAPERM